MHILFRFQEAFKTPLGDLFAFLLVATLTLSFFYFYLWFKLKKTRHLILKHQSEFKKTEKNLKEVTFLEEGIADFFGKNQMVAWADGRFGRSIIFYPELCDDSMIHRFRNYHLAMQQSDESYFPRNTFKEKNNLLVNIETQYVKRDGKSLVNFAHICEQSTLTISDKEHFLVNLAHILEALHQVHTEEGEPLYHGFLLPQAFYLTLDLVKKITNIFVAYHGCAFAVGRDTHAQWIQHVIQGDVRIDSQVKKQLETFSFIFSPEQRALTEKYKVGVQSDFYSFGALAGFLFLESEFRSIEDLNFDLIPREWRTFIRECLQENPFDRPQTFLELKEHFSHPDLELAQSYAYSEPAVVNSKNALKQEALKPFFDQVHKMKSEESHFNEAWDKGYKAIKFEAWDTAFSIFNEMMKVDPQAFNAHLGLALTYFQKGEQEKAKFHYLQAKKIDGKKIGSFHRLIAFDV